MSAATPTRAVRIAAWFLAVSYGVGAPLAAVAELREAALSARFGLAPGLIYLTSLLQLACAPAVLARKLAPWAALVLTGTTVGAIGAHLTTEPGPRVLPAIFYTAVQVWFGIRSRRRELSDRGSRSELGTSHRSHDETG